MKRSYRSMLLTIAVVVGFVWVGCGNDRNPLAPGSGQGIQPLAKRVANPGIEIEVNPVFRVPTDRPGEKLTVFVFQELLQQKLN